MPTLESLSSVILGNGCRLAFGEVLETRALDPARTMVTLSNEYSAEEATYHSCLDTSSLAEKLSVGAAFRFRSASVSGGARADYVRSLKKSSSSLHIVAHRRIIGATAQIAQPVPSARARKTAGQNFYQAYGDAYVSSVQFGSEFYMVGTLSTTSESATEELRAQFKMKTASYAFTADFASFLEQNKSTVKLDLMWFSSGVRAVELGGGISSNTPSGSLAYNQQLLRNLLDVVNSLPSQLAGHGTVVSRKYTAYAPAMGFPANRGDPDKLRRYVGSANVACGKLERRISTLNEAAQLNAARRFIEDDKLTNLQAQAEAAAAEIEVCVDAAVQRGAFQPLPPVKTGAIPGAPKLMCSETIAGDGGGADPGFPVPKGVLDQARGGHLYVAVATLGKANAKEVGQTPRAGLTVVFDDQDPQHAKVAWPPGDPWDYYAADQPYLYSKYAAVPIPPDTPAVHIFLPQGAAPHERWSVKVWV